MITKTQPRKEWFEARGVIRYSPQRLGNKESQKWWLVIDCPEEIGKYYRHVMHVSSHRCFKLQRPYWGAHISVIRNETPPNPNLWRKYDGEKIVFQYGKYIETNYNDQRWKSFWWLDAQCERALDIREELGLQRNPHPQFHLTIGNIANEENRRDRDMDGWELPE